MSALDSSDAPMFTGTTEQLCNALQHIAETRSNGATTKAVAQAAALVISQMTEDADRAAALALALQNLAAEMRHLLYVNPAKDGGLYRQRLDEAYAALEVKP